jgi:haloalkane dehalogenase
MSLPPKSLRTPESRFQNLAQWGYPFKPNYTTIHDLRVHYLDEGPPDASETILCLHGEPSWSFLYRKMIPTFTQAGYRVVAPDFIGFGRSDKLIEYHDYSHHLHTSTLIELVEKLDLQNITMVVQDWGATTGLSCVEHLANRIKRLVIMNAGLPPHGERNDLAVMMKKKFVRNVSGLVMWKALTKAAGQRLPVGMVFAASCPNISKEAIRGYNAPFPDKSYKAGVAWWPQMVPLRESGEVAAATRRAKQYLKTWNKPAFILFSDKCPVSSSLYEYFQALIPGASHYPSGIIRGAGHFLQEDAGYEISHKITEFVQKT